VKQAERSAEIDASPEDCFAALLDYESFPEWQRAVRSVEVLERDADGRGLDVAFRIDAKVKQVRYVLRYSYEPPRRVAWSYVEGDVRDVSGEFLLEDAGAGRTLATYRIELDAGVWMPGPVKKVLTDQVMKGAVDDLARRVTR
jgi:ribosome-associated toxin RatA of RatAB toxin-antitoxin module